MKNRKETDNYHDYEWARITFKPLSPHVYRDPLIYSMSKSFLETETPKQSYLIEELQSRLRILT